MADRFDWLAQENSEVGGGGVRAGKELYRIIFIYLEGISQMIIWSGG
jgi:hypothetical protein